ncbi:unnamed protein product [Spodoptera littoralis]|uniref:ZAD domain-containing protein n=1 Tax=Spodoptera littoralis TaxID=7109 RepID=A0A9P0IC23_SPOLI|nr:unnamed protein product [Spodoptera littoralis]CAH1643484.1 unnamed protein product [Spodoptera littoralis]
MAGIMDDKVDPKLFVTCRLCLQDLGQYQIVPKVQQQIKYCFNIDVDPFDGLPQLICVKCKGILNNFYEIKTLFSEKQADLRNRVTRKELSSETYLQHQQDTVSSSQQASDDTDTLKKKHSKKRVLNSSSSDDSELESSYTALTRIKRKSSKSVPRSVAPWELPYKKSMSCHLCTSVWLNKNSYTNHMRSHSHLVKKYKNILKRQCKINLVKIDGKPNLTGLADMVVHNESKIVAPGNSYFCTIYSKENPSCSSGEHIVQQKYEDGGSCSDDEDIVCKPTKRKKRFISRSSNETVVIASNSNKILSDLEEDSSTQFNNHDTPLIHNSQCINIDDSSDSELPNEENTQKVKQPIVARESDFQTIQDMISACVSSYTSKKNESSEIDSKINKKKGKKKDGACHIALLNHKVLSIGRKIVSKQGINCIRILRYLEYKDLDIVWLPNNASTHYIHISMTKSDALANDKESMWKSIPETVMLPESLPAKVPIASLPATLYLDNKSSNLDSKKILNAHPVANPKQLPRKLGPASESRAQLSRTFEEPAFCMPIIASTTSLAEVSTDQQNQEANGKTSATSGVSVEMTTLAPRIKVKPVSELMSQETLDSLKQKQNMPATNSIMLTNQIDNVWVQNKPANVFLPNVLVQPQVDSPNMQVIQMPILTLDSTNSVTVSEDDSLDYVILDTADLPNTKTKSPMSYLKSLLQIHNIVLLNTEEAITKDFITLIKFKALFKQNKTTPILLCLSLYCCKNTFSIQVRDRYQLAIDMFQMSANWQWEILQVYCGEVTVKALESARKHGQEVYDYTNHFYCLLKSINYRKA